MEEGPRAHGAEAGGLRPQAQGRLEPQRLEEQEGPALEPWTSLISDSALRAVRGDTSVRLSS